MFFVYLILHKSKQVFHCSKANLKKLSYNQLYIRELKVYLEPSADVFETTNKINILQSLWDFIGHSAYLSLKNKQKFLFKRCGRSPCGLGGQEIINLGENCADSLSFGKNIVRSYITTLILSIKIWSNIEVRKVHQQISCCVVMSEAILAVMY